MRKSILLGLVLLALPALARDPEPGTLPRRLPSLLRQVRSEPFGGTDWAPATYGLTGANKGADQVGMRLRDQVPGNAPDFVKKDRTLDGKPFKVLIADPLGDGRWMGFYRHSPRGGFNSDQASYRVAVYEADGKESLSLDLNPWLLREGTEIQDVRWRGGRLYFNEACSTYSENWKGRCSYLVAVDPSAKAVLWRTPALVSNNVFIFRDDATIVCGYGFTGEPDFLFLVDANTGEVKSRTKLDSAHDYLEIANGRLHVFTYARHFVFDFLPAGKSARPRPAGKPIAPVR
jgi:hypothetical protein